MHVDCIFLLSLLINILSIWLADEVEQTDGFVTFSLTNGPEYHLSQVNDSIIVIDLSK